MVRANKASSPSGSVRSYSPEISPKNFGENAGISTEAGPSNTCSVLDEQNADELIVYNDEALSDDKIEIL